MLETGKILSVAMLSEQICQMEINAPQIAAASSCGQFVNVKVNTTYDPLLRRPMSLHMIDKEAGTVTILFKLVGVGTALMSQLAKGSPISLMGPLGKGFNTRIEEKAVCLIAGGIGIAPLYALAEQLVKAGKTVRLLFGVRSSDEIFSTQPFSDLGIPVQIATEDGSSGKKGYVTDFLKDEPVQAEYLYACGPNPMLAAVQELALAKGLRGQVSLESYMACGLGACLVCACEKQGVAGYAKICQDGPVFNMGEVLIND